MGARISEAILRRVKEENDVADIVSGYVTLRKNGRNLKGLCPFHPEKTPSFIVTPEKGIFHCFGCGKGGDVISFVMLAESVSFSEAVGLLARRSGITIELDRENGEATRRKNNLLRINQAAADFFHQVLLSDGRAEPARRYLRERGLNGETITAFRLGYAPGGNETAGFLSKNGFAREEIERTGLRFYRRLMFPIHNLSGECVGFGARALDGSQPKYINTSENEVFRKGSFLYGLNLSRREIQEKDRVILVEGYTDLLKIRQSGFRNVAAGLGTALTPSQARQLRRFTGNLVLIYDGDAAGRSAAGRNLETLLGCDIETGVVTLPAEHDPDSFLDAFGAEALSELIGKAEDPFEFQLKNAVAEGEKGAASDRIAAARAVMPLLEALPSPLKRSEYLTMVAQRLGLAEEALREEYRRHRPGHGREEKYPARDPADAGKGQRGFFLAEKMLLAWGLEDTSLRQRVCECLTGRDFTETGHRRLFEVLAGTPGKTASPETIREQLSDCPEVIDDVTGSIAGFEPGDEKTEAIFSGCLETLLNRRREITETRPLLEERIRTSDVPDLEALRRFQALVLERHKAGK